LLGATEHATLLVDQAQKANLGDRIDWPVIRAALLALADAPEGAAALTEVVGRLNNPALVKYIKTWCLQVSQQARSAARQTARMREHRAVPLRNAALGVSGASALALALGTAALTGGVGLLLAGGIVVSGGSAYVADTLQGRENAQSDRADRVAALRDAL